MNKKNIARLIIIFYMMLSVSSCHAADIPKEAPKPGVPASGPALKAPDVKPSEKPPELVSTNFQTKDKVYDFTDASNWNLTVSAWEHLAEKDYAGTFAYARKCLELYEAQALDMARSMTRFASPGKEDEYAIVNDVATAHYIMGEAHMKEAKYNDAVKEFDLVIARYPFAQCWDPKGWFWKVAEVSKKNLDKIEKLKAGK